MGCNGGDPIAHGAQRGLSNTKKIEQFFLDRPGDAFSNESISA